MPSGHLALRGRRHTAGLARPGSSGDAWHAGAGRPCDVDTTTGGAVDAVVAGHGTLAYVPGGVVAGATRTLVGWTATPARRRSRAPPRAYVYPRLSPDGTRVAVYRHRSGAGHLGLDMGRATLTRVTFAPGVDGFPVWTPDGCRLISAPNAPARGISSGRRLTALAGSTASVRSQSAVCGAGHPTAAG